jgi:hypothetical protein
MREVAVSRFQRTSDGSLVTLPIWIVEDLRLSRRAPATSNGTSSRSNNVGGIVKTC